MAAKSDPSKRPVGAYPIKHHYYCPERTRKDVSYSSSLQTVDSDGANLRKESGILFEASMIKLMVSKFLKKDYKCIYFDVSDDFFDSPNKVSNLESPETSVVIITCEGDRTEAAKQRMYEVTLQCMSRGVRLIFGARLLADEFVGEPDAIVREQPVDSPRMHWTYLGLDFKDHKSFEGTAKASLYKISKLVTPFAEKTKDVEFTGKPQLVDSLQLVLYWKLLEFHKRAGDKVGGIIGREQVVVWRDLCDKYYWGGAKSAFELFEETYADFRKVQSIEYSRRKATSNVPPPTAPELKTACGECPWREVCSQELEEIHDISLLPDMTPPRGAIHRTLGIVSIQQLAKLSLTTAHLVAANIDVTSTIDTCKALAQEVPAVEVLGEKHSGLLEKLEITSSKQLASLDPVTAKYFGTKVWNLPGTIDQARVTRSNRVHRARSVSHVEIPRAAVELDIDIEDDAGGICYLIGVKETIRSRGEVKSQYIPFITWDNTPEAEAAMFAEFWDYMKKKRAWTATNKVGSFRTYYYTQHETRYFRHLVKQHAGVIGVPTSDELEEFLTSDSWIDMYPILAKQLIWPVRDRSLKTLAKYIRFFWRDDTPGGANSVAWYREAIDTKTDSIVSAELKKRILDYNEDDVDATFVLRDWISRFGETRRPGAKLPEVSALETRYKK